MPRCRTAVCTEHLAFVRTQRSVCFLQTPAWSRVKTEWRSESLGWYDGRQLVGAGLVLHRAVPRLERFMLACLPLGPIIDWAGQVGAWLGPPVRTNTWSAAQVKDRIADAGSKRLADLPTRQADPVGAGVTSRLSDAGWLPQSPEDGQNWSPSGPSRRPRQEPETRGRAQAYYRRRCPSTRGWMDHMGVWSMACRVAGRPAVMFSSRLLARNSSSGSVGASSAARAYASAASAVRPRRSSIAARDACSR
ncbi:FemAB family protein [Jiangella alkaliphila]|uniref:FemAB family protein n=1 Tax=Jiangella alkaliphila TaxID=419479 RepID=A0A1H2LEK7_9ACTN|nr:FemAB family protein [Jiangella alkaliphila]